MKTTMILFSLLALTACVSKFNTTDLTPGMTQAQVTQLLGKPVSATLTNGERQLIFKIHDDAFGRSDTFYAIGFKDDHLTSIAPLPEDMQEMGPIDRALRSRGLRSNNGSSYIKTPNAYGPGVHMDQYGRPVQVVPQ
ncbi:outer membrane protein assembly factor BamE domain-containing protein [Pelobacter propionicus]|uniref:outer membrane protein assembly factor BamE domain-containing protein n=1 Tax=Pelobacter propionicus TaxID=29543 RepID=UPI00059FC013|nr:outer membrane protein assembly factor BamE [Pelobacter propionicus]